MRRVWVIVVVLALLGAACGDDDDGDEDVATGEAPVELDGRVNDHGSADISDEGGAVDVELELDDFYFGPTYVKASPSQELTFVLENEGDAEHTFTIDVLDIDETVASGESAEVSVTVPDSGVLTFYCRFHRSDGMQGAIYTGSTGANGGTTSTPSGGVSGY